MICIDGRENDLPWQYAPWATWFLEVGIIRNYTLLDCHWGLSAYWFSFSRIVFGGLGQE